MTLLSARALALTLGQPLFSDLSFTLAAGDRLGLVAANGRGKTALLRCLAGSIDPTAGDITRARGLQTAFVPQNLPPDLAPLPLRQAVATGLADPSEEWRVDIALDDLAIPQALRDQPLATLSGGWQRSVLLARAAVGDPDLYLLDEPTNHLDLARIGHLQRWLETLPRQTAVIVTSHDRAFLDNVTSRSLFLRETASRLFALPFTAARAALHEADAADDRRFRNDLAKADQLRRQAAKLKNIGINSGSDLLTLKTRQLGDRAARIEAAARPAHRETGAGTIRLEGTASHARALLTLEDAAIATPDGRLLFRTGRKWIVPGDRVVLLGANGSGKTRLIKAVLAAARTGEASLRVAPSAAIGHSDQLLRQVPTEVTPFDLVSRLGPGDAQTRSALAAAGLRPEAQTRPAGQLSGGQRARLALLMLRLQRPNLYLLDEPTNHLDLEGQEMLEAELCRQEAACLLVSHDRAFLRATATRFWQISRGQLTEVDSPEPFLAAELGGG
ncbi:ATP-binding cassette domain-containing protein [Tabrizicola fusiformis]|uniref:ATP-binding cassette domain-containing protein n=1 Tax=Tabrizicola sp. SY72 TaxID=2741673 RepID=UPI001573B830|nr:ATP-binding cassette domain-containing protein [Tabrizicola sp. SY72]NTT86187.1 ABC-F family ATP-binding cassette domain-containing protein [Tabrizicola sp. SY72]